jgi:hypothetical protein
MLLSNYKPLCNEDKLNYKNIKFQSYLIFCEEFYTIPFETII